jgi:hypothetical protein
MKTSNRTLVGFGIGIAALVIITIILVLTLGRSNPTLLPENTPQGVVQRYLQAVQEKNYQVAYNYLAPFDPKNSNGPVQSFDNWTMSNQNSNNSTWKAELVGVKFNGDSASVTVMIDIFSPGGPLANPVRTNTMTFILNKTASSWMIITPTDLYWLY